jgi:hypothetical protein
MLKHSRVILSQVVDENRRRQGGNGVQACLVCMPGNPFQEQLVVQPVVSLV